METYYRPDPDELLERIRSAEKKKRYGRLKIFLGYAAGVGKTYAMLEAAHQRQAEGVALLVGYVETHGRTETEALLAGLETLPRQRVEYHGTVLEDMDLDAVLKRRPQLALVDELAHSNAPGLRHPKRYQDVEEILAQGIDVYTTMNIQHLESLNDVVAQITGVKVRETVPDHLLDETVEIELVDLPPDELLQRLREGKVYVPEQAARAVERFFRKGNLTALREMALRRAAERVDDQMRGYMQAQAIAGPWPAGERILVCISSHPLSERLVRAGRRLADELNGEWFVVYVETPDRMEFSAPHSQRVARSMRLAEQLGASVQMISGPTIPEAVIDFARRHNITKIVAGKPLRSRWQELLSGSVVDEIIRRSGSIDVYVISDQSGPVKSGGLRSLHFHSSFTRYLLGAALVVVITLLCWPVQTFLHPVNLVMPYLAAVVVSAVFLGRGPSMLASVISVLAYDFFFIDPRLSFSVSDTQYLITFFGLLVVGLVISNLAGVVRHQMEVLSQRATQTGRLYALSRELAVSSDLDAVLYQVIGQIGKTFEREAVILLHTQGGLRVRAASPVFQLDENELAVAQWAFDHDQPAGRGTDTLPAARIRYQPLDTVRGVVGVLGVKPGEPDHYLTPEQRQLLDAYAGLAALAIERAQLTEQANQARMAEVSDKLQSALLNSVSHDLRTPLVTITGVLSSLDEELQGRTLPMDAEGRRELVQTGLEEAERLNRLVANLLDMSRLESGMLRLNLERCDLEEIIGGALMRLGHKLEGRQVNTSIPDDLPLVLADSVLVEQVLINLLDNACKYSPGGTPIDIQVVNAGGEVRVLLGDRGPGIAEADLGRIFDKFYRANPPERVIGTGLGLSICSGIIEAHGGRIWAQNRPEGGAAILFTLPVGNAS